MIQISEDVMDENTLLKVQRRIALQYCFYPDREPYIGILRYQHPIYFPLFVVI